MDIDYLKAFVEVSEQGSFSAAAETLFLTQPAVSKRIAALETQLGSKVFDRIGKRVLLTEAGTLLLPRARKILTDVFDAKQAVKDLSGDVTGNLHVATSHHIGLHKLPPVLREFSRAYPGVNLHFDFLDSEIACERVLQGKSELALVTLPPHTASPLMASAIWEDPLVFIASKESALISSPTLETLSELPAILPDLNTYTGRLIHNFFQSEGLDLRVSMATNFLETIKMLCSVGLGWSVLPASMVDDQIRVLEMESTGLSRTLGIVQHEARTPSRAGKAFISELQK